MLLPTFLFALFALLSGVGTYLILAYHRGRGAGLIGAALTLLFFAVLYLGLLALFRSGGLA
jgi:hypothetical protein